MGKYSQREADVMQEKRIYEQVVDRIKNLLQSGEMQPGDKLPPERELAVLFKVSRSSIREAIRALQESGVLVSRRGDGTYVSDDTGREVLAPFAEALTRQRVRLWQLFQFRQALEPQIARLAAENATSSHLDAMQRILDIQKKELADMVVTGNADLNFHQLIAMATGNPLFLEVVTKAEEKLAETRHEPLQSAERQELSYRFHLRIYDAIAAGDSAAAEEAMADHLRHVESLLFETASASRQNDA